MAGADIYSVTMQNQTIVADATVVIIHTASSLSSRASQVEILRAWCSQHGTATGQQLGVMVAQKASAFGTYTSTAPVSHFIGGSASGIAGGTAGAAATSGTDASAEGAGTVTPIVYDAFNNLNGWVWIPTEFERIVVPSDTAVILKIVGTPTTLTGWEAGMTFRELS